MRQRHHGLAISKVWNAVHNDTFERAVVYALREHYFCTKIKPHVLSFYFQLFSLFPLTHILQRRKMKHHNLL